MNLTEKIKNQAKKNYARVGIGARFETQEQVCSLYNSAQKAANCKIAQVTIFGKKNWIKEYGPDLPIFNTNKPEDSLIKELEKGSIDAIVRGSAEANIFIRNLKNNFKVKTLYRIALLETATGYPFFLAPVGIDEGINSAMKMRFISYSIQLHKIFKIEPKIAILAGGRKEDLGRDKTIDKTIIDADLISKKAKKIWPNISINNYGILIEDAIKDKNTFILSPNGVSGNFIFRTLTFLGAGRAIGAPYVNIKNSIIDTSRAMKDYFDAIALASSLANR